MRLVYLTFKYISIPAEPQEKGWEKEQGQQGMVGVHEVAPYHGG